MQAIVARQVKRLAGDYVGIPPFPRPQERCFILLPERPVPTCIGSRWDMKCLFGHRYCSKPGACVSVQASREVKNELCSDHAVRGHWQ